MDLKVFWTDTARFQLEEIFDYYKNEVNLKTAIKLVSKIVDRTIQLEKHPRSGPKEPLLARRKFEYRFIVEGNYKVIYWIDKNYVCIASIFDCRQNPVNIKSI